MVFSRDSWQISVDWHAAGLAQIIFYLFVWWEVPSEDSVLNPQTPRLSKRSTKRFLWRLFSLFYDANVKNVLVILLKLYLDQGRGMVFSCNRSVFTSLDPHSCSVKAVLAHTSKALRCDYHNAKSSYSKCLWQAEVFILYAAALPYYTSLNHKKSFKHTLNFTSWLNSAPLFLLQYLIKVNEIKTKKGVDLLQNLIKYYHAQCK